MYKAGFRFPLAATWQFFWPAVATSPINRRPSDVHRAVSARRWLPWPRRRHASSSPPPALTPPSATSPWSIGRIASGRSHPSSPVLRLPSSPPPLPSPWSPPLTCPLPPLIRCSSPPASSPLHASLLRIRASLGHAVRLPACSSASSRTGSARLWRTAAAAAARQRGGGRILHGGGSIWEVRRGRWLLPAVPGLLAGWRASERPDPLRCCDLVWWCSPFWPNAFLHGRGCGIAAVGRCSMWFHGYFLKGCPTISTSNLTGHIKWQIGNVS